MYIYLHVNHIKLMFDYFSWKPKHVLNKDSIKYPFNKKIERYFNLSRKVKFSFGFWVYIKNKGFSIIARGSQLSFFMRAESQSETFFLVCVKLLYELFFFIEHDAAKVSFCCNHRPWGVIASFIDFLVVRHLFSDWENFLFFFL